MPTDCFGSTELRGSMPKETASGSDMTFSERPWRAALSRALAPRPSSCDRTPSSSIVLGLIIYRAHAFSRGVLVSPNLPRRRRSPRRRIGLQFEIALPWRGGVRPQYRAICRIQARNRIPSRFLADTLFERLERNLSARNQALREGRAASSHSCTMPQGRCAVKNA